MVIFINITGVRIKTRQEKRRGLFIRGIAEEEFSLILLDIEIVLDCLEPIYLKN